MQLFTLDTIKTKLKYDKDIFDGDFVDLDVELLGYINDAIDDAEAVIHSLYEDYFLNYSTISLVSGTSEYSLPSDIYGAKIRAILYTDGSKKYELKRFKHFKETLFVDSGATIYKYILINPANTASTGSFKAKLYPTPAETNSDRMTIWYIRNAKRLSSASDYCDIPEFINFIYAHVKWSISVKEKMGMDVEVSTGSLKAQRDLMEVTLTDMIPDEGNDVAVDLSFYEDFDSNLVDGR